MGRILAALTLALAACGPVGAPSAPSPSAVGCDVVVTRAADGRTGTAGCLPTTSPAPVRVVAPAPGRDEHKGKGRD